MTNAYNVAVKSITDDSTRCKTFFHNDLRDIKYFDKCSHVYSFSVG